MTIVHPIYPTRKIFKDADGALLGVLKLLIIKEIMFFTLWPDQRASYPAAVAAAAARRLADTGCCCDPVPSLATLDSVSPIRSYVRQGLGYRLRVC